MEKIIVKVIRGDYRDMEVKLLDLLNDGYVITANVVISNDDYLYAILTKKITKEK